MQSHCEWPLALLSNTSIFQVGRAIINYLFIIIAQKLCGTCTISLQIKKGYLVVSVSKLYNVQPSGCYMYIAAMFGGTTCTCM